VCLALGLALLVVTVAGAAVTTSKVRHIDVNKAGAKKIRITGDWLAAGRRGIWLSGMEEIYRLNRAPAANRSGFRSLRDRARRATSAREPFGRPPAACPGWPRSIPSATA
jgi:hypothetical protein